MAKAEPDRCTRTAASRFGFGSTGSSDAGFAASARTPRQSVSSDVRCKMIALADIISTELGEPAGRDLQERLLQAMFMIERYRGIDAGWRDTVAQVADADVSEEAITRLADSLRVFIRLQKQHPDVGSAIWALGKLRAPEDRAIYEDVLAEGSGYSTFARNQSMVALEDARA